MKRLTRSSGPLVLLVLISIAARGQDILNGHRVLLDAQGKIIPWVEPQEKAYDRVMRLAWDFLLHTVPVEPNGLKTYLAYCCLDPKKLHGTDWPHNPAGLYSMFVDSAAAYYAYSGDREVVRVVREMLDHQLVHGTTPSAWAWGRVPYASADAGAVEYFGADDLYYCSKGHHVPKACGAGDGHYFIEPDKVGELGFGYLKFFELTGETKYRDAAIACADALARHVRPGDGDHSPWPFRVHAERNEAREEYSADVIGPIRLFDELTRLGLGEVATYQKARRTAWDWMMAYPMRNNGWSGYFEDVYSFDKPINFNQYTALETARYLMFHPEFDPEWRMHVPGLIRWVEKTFVVDIPREPAVQWGANAVSEQIADMNKMCSHTSRYASLNALWYEMSGDEAAKEKAFRSFNWATYMCREDGAVLVGPIDQSIWFSDGFGDYIRHFMAGLGAVPEWAPRDELHLLRSSSVVETIAYRSSGVEFTTFDDHSTEVLRVNFSPREITTDGEKLARRSDLSQPGWTFDERTGVLRVRHDRGRQVRIMGAGGY